MSLIDTRRHQLFPVLDAGQIETARRFASGPARDFAPGEIVFDVGERHAPAWLVLKGSIDVVRRDGLDREAAITTHHAGQFSGEVSQLAGRQSLASGRAGAEGCTALPFDAAHVRALMVGSAEVGEIMMRAFILRRVGLIEEGGVGSVLVGRPGTADLIRLARLPRPQRLSLYRARRRQRCRRPRRDRAVWRAAGGAAAHALPERDRAEAAERRGGRGLPRHHARARSGHGLSTWPWWARVPRGSRPPSMPRSEGLSVLVLDSRAIGGQAGASARIENYLGFPTGISGMALAGRAFNQALKFGVEIAIPLEVARLDCGGSDGRGCASLRLELTNGDAIRARTVVVASGARYRRPPIPNLASFEGAGVSYWASPVEAKLCEGEEVALVGGGNSAGQAVVFLAPKVERLHLVVRGRRIGSLDVALSHRSHRGAAQCGAAHPYRGRRLGRRRGGRSHGRACSATAATGITHTCPLRHSSCSSAPTRMPPGSTAASRWTARDSW